MDGVEKSLVILGLAFCFVMTTIVIFGMWSDDSRRRCIQYCSSMTPIEKCVEACK